MARALAIFISSLVCIILTQAALAQKSVFALVQKEPGRLCLQEWDPSTLDSKKEWPLNPKYVKWLDTSIYVDRSANKAIVGSQLAGEKVMILDLKTLSERLVPQPSKWDVFAYRFEKGSLEALIPVPIIEGQTDHWQVLRLVGDDWVERRELRTSSLAADVSGFRWHALTTEVLERAVPLDRLGSFGSCGNGGGTPMILQVFGYSSLFGCIDVYQNRALVLLDGSSEDSEFALLEMIKPGLTFIPCPREFRHSAVALCGDKIVYARGDGWAAVSDLNGKVLKKRQVRASLVFSIG